MGGVLVEHGTQQANRGDTYTTASRSGASAAARALMIAPSAEALNRSPILLALAHASHAVRLHPLAVHLTSAHRTA